VGLFLLVVLCLASFAEKSSRANSPEAKPISLSAGSSTKLAINAGEKNVFGLALDPGYLLRVSIDKGDLALAVTLYDPAGHKVFDQTSFYHEDVSLSVPLEMGTYLLEVRSLEISGPARDYELKVEPSKRSTRADEKVSAAQRATASATIKRAEWTETSLRQAIKKYEEAALIWMSMNNLQAAAAQTIEAGEICFALGEYQEALRHYRKAAAQAKTGGAKLEESRALREVGRLYSYLGDNDQAESNVLAALRLLAPNQRIVEPEFKDDYAVSLNNLGEISYARGDLVKSSKQFAEALQIFDEVGDRSEAARAHLFRGYIVGGLGNREKAVAEFSRSLELYSAVRNKAGEGLSLTALGLMQSTNGEDERAISKHREAIAIFQSIGDGQSEAIAVNGLGQAYENLMDYNTALENYEQALSLFQDGGTRDFAAVATSNVARAYRLMGDFKKAVAYYEKCLILSRAAKKVRTEANALNDLAAIYAAQGNREKTISQYRILLKFYDAMSDRRQQAMAWNHLGDAYLGFAETQQALTAYERALPLSKQTDDKAVLLSSLFNLARAHSDLGHLEAALSNIEQSIKIIEDLRSNVANPDFRTSYFSGVHKHYALWIDVLMQLDEQRPGEGFAAAGLLASEKARARSLLDNLTDVGANIDPGADPELLSRKRELEGLLRAHAQYQMELSISGKNSAKSEEAACEVNELRTEYQEIESRLVERNPRLQSPGPPAVSSLAEVQTQLLDGDTILLEYALGEDRSYLWAVTADSLHSYQLPSASSLETTGREVYKLLTARQAVGETIESGYLANVEDSDRLYTEKARELSQMLLGQVADQLGSKRLVIVSEGILQYIPFEALPAPQPQTLGSLTKAPDMPLLVASHEIVTLPSISTLAAIRKEKHKVASGEKVVAVLADPVFSKNDDRVQNGTQTAVITSLNTGSVSGESALRSLGRTTRQAGPTRLVHASEEADAILAATPRGTAMIARGFDASREVAMSSLIGDYKIVHFATHGFLNTDHPELSGIVMTMVNHDGSRTNGFMSLQDIYNLNLSADLVVLSACDTALGKDIRGEGLVGLTHGFMASGAKSVVATLWKVDDRATAVFMATFYEALLKDGLTPVAALRTAKQRVRQEKAWQAPYFWAGFVLQGEYNQRIVVQRSSWQSRALATVVTLIFILIGMTIYQRRRRRVRLMR
jgi:CHAT domain-containing protein/Flp pilus assembly protein TadD